MFWSAKMPLPCFPSFTMYLILKPALLWHFFSGFLPAVYLAIGFDYLLFASFWTFVEGLIVLFFKVILEKILFR